MTENIFTRGGVGGGAGMLVHEATKNFPKGRRFFEAGPLEDAPAQWIYRIYPQLRADSGYVLPRKARRDLATLSGLDTLARRRSIRAYAPGPLAVDVLAAFLTLSYPAEVGEIAYAPAPRPHQQLGCWNGHVTACRLILLVRNVQGIASGAYVYDERRHTLLCVRAASGAELDALLEASCFQAEFRGAPVLALQVGSVADSVARYGERGYRYMLFEDGVQIQRMYLAASSLGLAACITGSIVQRDFEAWLGLDGYWGSVLNAFALGEMPSPKE